MMSYPFRRMCLVAVAVVISAVWPQSGSAQGNKKTSPLSVTVVDDACGTAPAPSRICSDGRGPYVDQEEGRSTPDVYSTSSGSIEMNLNGSTRTLCFVFEDGMSSEPTRPKDSCSPVLLRTLTRADIGGVTLLPPGTADVFSLRLSWTAIGADSKAHDYKIELSREHGNGVYVVASGDGNSWTITPDGPTPVSVHIKSGKTGYWTPIAEYQMAFKIVAARF